MLLDDSQPPVLQVLDRSMLIGVPSIDDEHRALFSRLNLLIDKPDALPESEDFCDILSRLGIEIDAHFHSEERVFTSCGMPDDEVADHIHAHTEILEQYTELNLELMQGRRFARSEVLLMIRDWIIDHLLTYDLRIRKYLPSSS
jgi:hemerythrin